MRQTFRNHPISAPDHMTAPASAGSPARPGSPAFTLVDLLVTLAIIALLMAILLSSLKGMRAAAWSAKCSSNLHQVAAACGAYMADRRVLPHAGQGQLIPLLELPGELWICPANHGLPEAPGINLDSYHYPAAPTFISGQSPSGQRNHRWDIVSRVYDENRRAPLVEDMVMWHGYRNVAGLDGAVTQQYEGGLETIAIGP
jgi:hypothetical protein